MDQFRITDRVEEREPTDRVRGTVVNVDGSGIFVVKYDNGDYVAYQPEEYHAFKAIPDKPVPGPVANMIHVLNQQLGRTPPEDVVKRRKVPRSRSSESMSGPVDGDALTPDAEPPTIEA